jgi:metal-sulfur cluster biosynthetic enzyme
MITNEQIIETLKTVKDPEVHIDVWTMGLIYNLEIKDDIINILMTYTTPFCPWGPDLQENIKSVLQDLGAKTVNIEVTFDPPYKMPEALRATLGI